MTIDCTQKIKNLQGVAFKTAEGEELTLGAVLAEILATDQTGGKMKLYSLAQQAYSKDSFEVDAADLAIIKKAAETTKAYQGNAIVLGQALELLEAVK